MTFSSGWLEEARIVKSPNFNQRPASVCIDLLVIHNISLPPGEFGGDEVERFFQNRLNVSEHPFFEEIAGLEVSSHFYIRRTGEIVQFVSTEERAWHAGVSSFDGRENCNDFSIGIELEGTDDVPYETAQYDSLVRLTQQLMVAYPEITSDRIQGHCDIAPSRKTDPGPAFDWAHFLGQLS
jgi:AmpD protein